MADDRMSGKQVTWGSLCRWSEALYASCYSSGAVSSDVIWQIRTSVADPVESVMDDGLIDPMKISLRMNWPKARLES